MRNHAFYSFDIDYFYDSQLAAQLLPVARKFLSDPSKLTNEWNYKNTYTNEYGLSTEEEFELFTALILEKSKEYLDKKKFKLKQNLSLWVSLFASEMTFGDQHTSHCHPGALLSGLIYLQVPPESAKLEFMSPRYHNPAWVSCLDGDSYQYDDDFFKVNSNHIIEIKPVDGLFLLWESWALHRVPPNLTDGRITLIFNVGAE
jgi:uncharacterized protein (TIGR02466 family)